MILKLIQSRAREPRQWFRVTFLLYNSGFHEVDLHVQKMRQFIVLTIATQMTHCKKKVMGIYSAPVMHNCTFVKRQNITCETQSHISFA